MRLFVGLIEGIIFAAKFVRPYYVQTVPIITIVVNVGGLIFGRKQNPARIELNVYMELLLLVVFFYRRAVNTNDVANTFDLGTIFGSLTIENTIHELETIPLLRATRMVSAVNNFHSANVFVRS
jgi:hypothetical protein